MNWMILKEEPDTLSAPWPDEKRQVLLWHVLGFAMIGMKDGVWRINDREVPPRFLSVSFTHWCYIEKPT